MAIKPWHKVATPRQDLCDGKPLDASEFAVHLDHIREKRARPDYQNPEQFFERTYLTGSLMSFAAEVVRRLSGDKTETNAVFNMATQFGGGKTHALTLLYHLAENGPKADGWNGVRKILERAGVRTVPQAATAVFVGTEFDVVTGRGGEDGTPRRTTPWGEIAYQLGGDAAEHDEKKVAPGGDVIRQFLPENRPCLVLMDELMNYVSGARRLGIEGQFYRFIQNMSEEFRGRDGAVLAVSIPASEMVEMSSDDQADYTRLKKLLDRLGKAVMMSAESETSEIIRRRLFEWDPGQVSADGKVLLPREAVQACNEYAEWVTNHPKEIPGWFPADNAREAFIATYPFHPMVLSVFERKWQTLPRFQRTRGVLRLLALWVSHAYQSGFKSNHRDALISIGTAPLEDLTFRLAVTEQLDESRLEAVITTDICGKPDSFATRLDKEAVNGIKKARLHRKVATTIFFESNGGQTRDEATEAEIRLAVAEPDVDIGNLDTVLDALTGSCYYLSQERKSYRFGLSPNLNKILSDRRASVRREKIEERVRAEIKSVFEHKGSAAEKIYFPTKSNHVPDRPVLTLIVLAPEQSAQEPKTSQAVESITREHGGSSRTFKSALIWCVPDNPASLYEEARKVLAWEEIKDEEGRLGLEEGQRRQLSENLAKSRRDLSESVWRTYQHLLFLGKDNTFRPVDLGLVHSSAADSMTLLVLNRLRQEGELEDTISPNTLAKKWPPAFEEWSTKAVRDVFYASPQFPRITTPDVVKTTIAQGVTKGVFAYAGKAGDRSYVPFHYNEVMSPQGVEISEDVFLVKRESAEAYLKSKESPAPAPPQPPSDEAVTHPVTPIPVLRPDHNTGGFDFGDSGAGAGDADDATKMVWSGDVTWQKWQQFYNKVLAKFVMGKGLKISVSVEVTPEGGVSKQKVEETKAALRELGLNDDVQSS
jgi:hypothetical protein